uniref:C2H2-type domain-containing protein n=1 Tax=Culex tarsalis TaxID=7177 RepID=A0A1Q3F9B2_CULTA
MSQHFGSGTCSGFFDAIGTCPVQYRRVQVLQCNTCGYKSDQIGNMQRHQATQGHEGFVKSKPPRPDEYQSAADQTDEDDPTTRVKPCPHCGQEMQARNLGRHARLYCAVLLKKPAKLGTDYDVPEDEHGLPVLKCEDCGKSFHHYYYMKKHLENGCPVLKRLAKGAGADGKQRKRNCELPESESKFREVVPLECEVKVEEQ